MKTTNINEVRDVAISFAYLPIEQNEKFPFLVSHPFLNTVVTAIPTKNGPEMINILEENNEE